MDTQSLRLHLPSGETAPIEEIVGAQGESYRHTTTIDMLTDNILLEIFDFYRNNQGYSPRILWKSRVGLAHVCQRWRQIIFESPLRLNLEIQCTHKTPVLKNLGIWPASFPIAIDYATPSGYDTPPSDDEEGNVNAALEHRDRVCRIKLSVTCTQLAKLVTAMQEPFLALTHLDIYSDYDSEDEDAAGLPAGFLGASAPRLQELRVRDIPYPALPTLLLSTNNLITLYVSIPSSGRISPKAMVVGLAALSKLETLTIVYETPFSRQIFPPVTRVDLPALTSFRFYGVSEYLEDLVAQMDCPQLNHLVITYREWSDPVPVTELPKFVDRSVGPKLTLFKYAEVVFDDDCISFSMSDWHPETRSIISFEGRSWESSHELLGQFSVTGLLSNVAHLKLTADDDLQSDSEDSDEDPEHFDDVRWLHLLRQFSSVQTLRVSQVIAGYVALALEDITVEEATESLPFLDLICLEGQSASSAGKFVAARGLSDRPVTVVETMTEFCGRLDSESSVKFYTED